MESQNIQFILNMLFYKQPMKLSLRMVVICSYFFLCSLQWVSWTHPPQGSSKIWCHLSRHQILRCLNFGIGESLPNLFLDMMNLPHEIWSIVNLEWMGIFLFCYFVYLESESWTRKNKSAWWIFIQFFAAVNLDPNFIEKYLDLTILLKKVNRGEDLRWVGSRCPLTRKMGSWILNSLQATQ